MDNSTPQLQMQKNERVNDRDLHFAVCFQLQVLVLKLPFKIKKRMLR